MNHSSEGDKTQWGTGRLNGKVAIVTGADRGYVLETGNLALERKCEDLLTDARVKKAYLGQ
jgi:ABC-type branched-subunit amino acid transport system ATPase component